jgi:hypothetical protein
MYYSVIRLEILRKVTEIFGRDSRYIPPDANSYLPTTRLEYYCCTKLIDVPEQDIRLYLYRELEFPQKLTL